MGGAPAFPLSVPCAAAPPSAAQGQLQGHHLLSAKSHTREAGRSCCCVLKRGRGVREQEQEDTVDNLLRTAEDRKKLSSHRGNGPHYWNTEVQTKGMIKKEKGNIIGLKKEK